MFGLSSLVKVVGAQKCCMKANVSHGMVCICKVVKPMQNMAKDRKHSLIRVGNKMVDWCRKEALESDLRESKHY